MKTAADNTYPAALTIVDHVLILLDIGASLPRPMDFVWNALQSRRSQQFVTSWLASH